MPSGKAPSARSVAIKKIIDNHCSKNNIKLEVFLKRGNGGEFVQGEISDLQVYNRKDVNNSLRRIRATFASPPKKSTPYNMQDSTNNKRSADDMMDESVAKPPSPINSVKDGNYVDDGNYFDDGNYTPRKRARTPVKAGSSYREPNNSSVENDDRNGGFKFSWKNDADPIQPAIRTSTSSPFVVGSRAHSQDSGDDVSPLTTQMGRTSIADKRMAETIINDSNLPVESLALVTDAIEFDARATVSGGLTPEQVTDGVIRIRDEQQHFNRLNQEITKEKKNRKAIIEGYANAIVAKRAEILATESHLVALEKELDNLEERKAEEVLDEKKQCDKAEALYNLGMHCFGTLRKCADFAVQGADAAMAAANDLVAKHYALQDAYKNGEYDKLLKSNPGEVKKQLFQKK